MLSEFPLTPSGVARKAQSLAAPRLSTSGAVRVAVKTVRTARDLVCCRPRFRTDSHECWKATPALSMRPGLHRQGSRGEHQAQKSVVPALELAPPAHQPPGLRFAKPVALLALSIEWMANRRHHRASRKVFAILLMKWTRPFLWTQSRHCPVPPHLAAICRPCGASPLVKVINSRARMLAPRVQLTCPRCANSRAARNRRLIWQLKRWENCCRRRPLAVGPQAAANRQASDNRCRRRQNSLCL